MSETTQFGHWHGSCVKGGMVRRLARLFVIKTKFEAFLVIYALATGAVERGFAYMRMMPGAQGKILFLACTAAVFMAGGKILDALEMEEEQGDPR